MLVSSIARFQAINTMNNAAFASIQSSDNMLHALRNLSTFSGDYETLNDWDKKFSLALLTNSLTYRLASLQEKLFAKMQKDELERNKISYIA